MRKSLFELNRPDISCEAIESDSIDFSNELATSIESIALDLVQLKSLEGIRTTIRNSIDNNNGFDIGKMNFSKESIQLLGGINLRSMSLFAATETHLEKDTKDIKSLAALESVSDSIKNLSNRILESIKNIWEKVKEFFAKIFDRKSHIVENLQDQLDDLENLNTDNYKGSDKVSIAKEDNNKDLMSTVIPFGIKGSCDYETTRTILRNSRSLIEANVTISDNIKTCLSSINHHKSFDGIHSDVNQLVNTIKKFIGKLQLVSKRIDGPKEIYIYGYLVDQQVCEMTEYVNKSHSSELLKLFNIEVKITDDDRREYLPKLLKKEEMAELGKLAIQLVEESKQIDNLIPSIDAILQSNVDYIRNNDEVDNIGLLTLDLINDLFKYTTHNLPKASSDANKVAIYIGRYIKYCVAQYKQAL